MYETLINSFLEKLKFAPDFKKIVKFIVTDHDDKMIIVDTTERPAVVTYDDREADVTLTASKALFESLMNGTKDPTMAFMTRQLKISGSMGVAMRLNAILED